MTEAGGDGRRVPVSCVRIEKAGYMPVESVRLREPAPGIYPAFQYAKEKGDRG